MLEFKEVQQRVDIKGNLEWMENWFGMPVQVRCTMPRAKQLKTLIIKIITVIQQQQHQEHRKK